MWPEGFDPERLTRDASLNKLVIGHSRGAQAVHAGENGGDLLGRDAVVKLVQERCGVDVRADAVADWLNAASAADSPRGAAAVLDEVGDRLASLIATLRDPASAVAATGGRRTYLEVWQRLDRVMLGGGLMKGGVGERVAARAAAVLAAHGVDPPTMEVVTHPEWLALLGAARSASEAETRVVVLDGGQTSIKRGIAVFQDRDLVSMRVFAPLPVTSIPPSRLSEVVAHAARELLTVEGATGPEVMFSVASYLRNGRPLRYHASIYEHLDLGTMHSRYGVRVRLIHDGTAAWRGADTQARSAVIMLGTWLGVGIGPHREPVRPYSADFAIDTDAGGV